jgi:hypothetical protein
MKKKNNHNNDNINDNNSINKHQKSLICIYTNKDKNEFYTRFVDVFDQVLNDENEIDWKQALKRWIAAAKKNESIFVEVDLSGWNEAGERMKK